MFSRLAAPAANVRGNGAAPAPVKTEKSVPDLLAELADVRAQKAALERREGEIVAAAQARLLHDQKTLEQLKKKVSECGIEVNKDGGTAQFPAVNREQQSGDAAVAKEKLKV